MATSPCQTFKGESMEENDVYGVFLKRLASAVILRALIDLKKKRETYTFTTARNFCLGVNDFWFDSLKVWCDLAGVDIEKVRKKARGILKC